MQVAEGKINRVFTVRLEEGERLPDCIETLARQRRIKAALVLLVGGARDGRLVVGPKKTTANPAVMVQAFTAGHEILGVGTLFPGEQGPELHLHAAMGRKQKALVGCIRKGIRTYLIAEIVILELTGFTAVRARHPVSGFHLLELNRAATRSPRG